LVKPNKLAKRNERGGQNGGVIKKGGGADGGFERSGPFRGGADAMESALLG